MRQIRNIAIFAAVCLLLLFLVISGIRAIIGLVKGGDEAETSGTDTVQETLLEGGETMSAEDSGDGEMPGGESASESSSEETSPAETAPALSFESTIPKPAFFAGYTPQGAGVPITIGEVGSTYGVLIDMDTGTVVAGREADTVITAFGLKADREQIEALKDVVADTYVIGDAGDGVKNIPNANYTAFHSTVIQ